MIGCLQNFTIRQLRVSFALALALSMIYPLYNLRTAYQELTLHEHLLRKGETRKESNLFNPFQDMKLSLMHNNQQKDRSIDNKHKKNFQSSEISNKTSDKTIYSSRHCIKSQNWEGDPKVSFVTRTCHFKNLYFHPQNGTFHYFPNPNERSILQDSNDAWQTLENDMTVAVGNIQRKDAKDLKNVPKTSIWHPVIERHSMPPDVYARIDNPSNLMLLIYRPFYSFNIGHFLWDDALSLFSMMDSFGFKSSSIYTRMRTRKDEDDNGIFPLPFYVDEKGFDNQYYTCSVYFGSNPGFKDRWAKCTKTYYRMFPIVFRYQTHETGDILRSGNWLKGEDQEWLGFRDISDVKSDNVTDDHSQANQMPNGTSFALVPNAIAGSGRMGQYSCDGDCSVDRASQFYSFREFILGNVFWPDYDSIVLQKKVEGLAGYITFSLPVGSSRPEEVSFFENVIPVAKTLYGEDKVKVVDMAKVSGREEAMIALDTAVLFVNHGGGSSTSIFLQRGSSVFLYAAGGCSNKGKIWCDEGKNHFDSVFYNSNGYIRSQWIEREDRENTEKIKALMQSEYEQTLDSWEQHGYKIRTRTN